MNIGMHVSFQIDVLLFFQIYTQLMVVLSLVFWEISILFSTVAAPAYIPPNSVQGFLFLLSS